MTQTITSLTELLERFEGAASEHKEVSVGMIMEAVGNRSFGPILLMAGIILFSPLSGIPGMPTTMATLVFLIAVQLFLHRDHFWLPRWVLRRSIASKKMCKAVGALKRPAGFIDRWLRPRLTAFTHSAGKRVIAALCILIALGTPAMEVVPFSASSAGAAITAFGLSLIAEDGLLALLALLLIAATVALVIYAVT